ncbi:MAG TPA: hypothetical protein DIU04_21875, partial [Pseudomonas sp.]|nr:hypothetical protein [Pseudomonas sp.]
AYLQANSRADFLAQNLPKRHVLAKRNFRLRRIENSVPQTDKAEVRLEQSRVTREKTLGENRVTTVNGHRVGERLVKTIIVGSQAQPGTDSAPHHRAIEIFCKD